MVLLEANEFFLEDDSTAVDDMVGWYLVKVLPSRPHVPPVYFIDIFVGPPEGGHAEEDESEPEAAVL